MRSHRGSSDFFKENNFARNLMNTTPNCTVLRQLNFGEEKITQIMTLH